MDIYSFVNSKDICEHLRKIKYGFNSLETAWLIYQCKRMTYEEKKVAWRELIDTMPDCEVPARCNCHGWGSLHSFLLKYMEIIDKEVSNFSKDNPGKGYVYMYSFLYKDDVSWIEEYKTIYDSYEKCIQAYKKIADDLDETYVESGTGVVKYRVKRQHMNDSGFGVELEFNGKGQLMDVWNNSERTEEDSNVIDNSFMGLWFSFPTPFEKGDIVWVPKAEGWINWDCDGGFVLEGLSTWNPRDIIVESGDYSDMNGYGLFVNPNGTVYHEVMMNYMDLEFYKGPYKMNERILPALSKYLKGEIPIDLLMCAYRKVLLDLASDDIMLKAWYSPDILKEIGI